MPDNNTIKIAAILLIFLAVIPASIAKKKGGNFILWYIFGYGLFLFAMIFAIMMPPKELFEGNFDEAREIDDESQNQDVVITSSRITDCYVSSPVDALSYQIIKNKQDRKLACKVNLFSNLKPQKLDVFLTLLNYHDEKLAELSFLEFPFSDVVEFDISEYPQTTSIRYDYDNVVEKEGNIWRPSGEKVKYEIEMVDGYHLEEIKRLTNKYAFCYPQEYKDYWVCACSKANNLDVCVLCGIEKKQLFNILNSKKIHEMKNEEKIRKNLEEFHANQAKKMLAREEQ